MSREVANLIRENSELMQTKHALNVVKDDLIVKLDNFSSEMVILNAEIRSLQTVKTALQQRITQLEEEAKIAKEELAAKTRKIEEEDVSDFQYFTSSYLRISCRQTKNKAYLVNLGFPNLCFLDEQKTRFVMFSCLIRFFESFYLFPSSPHFILLNIHTDPANFDTNNLEGKCAHVAA